jgi:hypothetical protein
MQFQVYFPDRVTLRASAGTNTIETHTKILFAQTTSNVVLKAVLFAAH